VAAQRTVSSGVRRAAVCLALGLPRRSEGLSVALGSKLPRPDGVASQGSEVGARHEVHRRWLQLPGPGVPHLLPHALPLGALLSTFPAKPPLAAIHAVNFSGLLSDTRENRPSKLSTLRVKLVIMG